MKPIDNSREGPPPMMRPPSSIDLLHAWLKRAPLPREILFAPAGVRTIQPRLWTGFDFEITVDINRVAVEPIRLWMAYLTRKGGESQPFCDWNHLGKLGRTFWPGKVSWSDSPKAGLWVEVRDWTPFGIQLLLTKSASYFSPSLIFDFVLDDLDRNDHVLRFREGTRGSKENPSEVLGVKSCIGALVDEPAFPGMPRIWELPTEENPIDAGGVDRCGGPIVARAAVETASSVRSRTGYQIQRDIDLAVREERRISNRMREFTLRGRCKLAEDEILQLIPTSARREDLEAHKQVGEKLKFLREELDAFHLSRAGAALRVGEKAAPA